VERGVREEARGRGAVSTADWAAEARALVDAARARAAAGACQMTKLGKHTLTTCKSPSASYSFTVTDAKGEKIGKASIVRVSRDGRDAYTVNHIEVDPKYRRARLGTKLYEKLVATACKEKLSLQSDYMRSHFAEAFWRKQEAKGRATCEETQGTVYEGPVERLRREVMLGLRTSQEVDAIVAKLPMPDGRNWACGLYRVSRPCATKSLKGLGR